MLQIHRISFEVTSEIILLKINSVLKIKERYTKKYMYIYIYLISLKITSFHSICGTLYKHSNLLTLREIMGLIVRIIEYRKIYVYRFTDFFGLFG